MVPKNIIITGSGGFIGTNFIASNPDFKFYRLTRDKSGEIIISLNQKKVKVKDLIDIEFTLLHLATFFSKNKNEKSNVRNGNIEFGKEVLSFVENLKINKIVYTNTMYKFYRNEEIKNLEYTKSKILLSEYFEQYCKFKNIYFEEVYLDNTYGKGDKRDKVIPAIIKSINNNKENPINNADAFINLISVNDVVSRLKIATIENLSYKSAFISSQSVNLFSIYSYLNSVNKNLNPEILVYQENNYKDVSVNFDYKNINLKPLESGLISLLK